MLPLELKNDDNGLLYTDDIDLIRQRPLNLDNRSFENERYYSNEFFPLKSTEDYILKFSTTVFTRREAKKIKEMLDILVRKQKDISNVDFPVGYYVFKKKICGLIVPYYKNGISCDHIFNHRDIEELGKYYSHDEDNLHNITLLLYDLLDLIYEMYENGIYYSDMNPGNIIITDNQIKLIDFDYRFVTFNDKDIKLRNIMSCYRWLLNYIIDKYKLGDTIYYRPIDFEDAKHYTKKLENSLRK